MLDFSPAEAELDQVQFESEWSLFRSPFASKKRVPSQTVTPSSTAVSLKSGQSSFPSSRPTSPTPHHSIYTPRFPSISSTMSRARVASTASLQSFLTDGPPPSQTPQELVIFLSALHTLLTDSDINPAIITQLWSQVMYWTAGLCSYIPVFLKVTSTD